MKVVTSFSLSVELLTTAKARAQAEGRSFSALLEEALAAYVATKTPQTGPAALSKRAQLVLEAVTALTQADLKLTVDDPAWMFLRYRIDQVCRKLGTFPSTTLPYLRECERAGVLICAQLTPLGMDAECPKLDHWRLPSE